MEHLFLNFRRYCRSCATTTTNTTTTTTRRRTTTSTATTGTVSTTKKNTTTCSSSNNNNDRMMVLIYSVRSHPRLKFLLPWTKANISSVSSIPTAATSPADYNYNSNERPLNHCNHDHTDCRQFEDWNRYQIGRASCRERV